jgi:hypothetical protein
VVRRGFRDRNGDHAAEPRSRPFSECPTIRPKPPSADAGAFPGPDPSKPAFLVFGDADPHFWKIEFQGWAVEGDVRRWLRSRLQQVVVASALLFTGLHPVAALAQDNAAAARQGIASPGTAGPTIRGYLSCVLFSCCAVYLVRFGTEHRG